MVGDMHKSLWTKQNQLETGRFSGASSHNSFSTLEVAKNIELICRKPAIFYDIIVSPNDQ